MKLFKSVFPFVFVVLLSMIALPVNAETRAYKYSHSVKDEIKVNQNFSPGIWYITFNSDKSKLYLTDENGVSRTGEPDAVYMGTENGIHIYKGNLKFLGVSYFYFSSDFKRLNWDCIADNSNNTGPKIIRVLNYVPNPKTANAPTHLY